MHELDDSTLLRRYVEGQSDEAFTTLVSRHINKVYSVALRHTGNSAQAEEITQAVFVMLAQKSSRLSKHVILSGWLYQAARLTAVTLLRSEIRRKRREQEACMQNFLKESEPAVWSQIAPALDAALAGLSEKDRHAIVLRFFDGKSMKDTGAALGVNEDAAKMRISRAVEKLRRFFIKRGVTVSAAVLGTTLSTSAVQSAPPLLATSVSAVAAAKGAAASSSTVALTKSALKMMAWIKAKTAIVIGTAVLLTAGTGIMLEEIFTPHGPVETLIKFDWQKLKDQGQLSGGEIVRMDGTAVLKLVGTNQTGIRMRLLTIDNPPITKMDYALSGQIKYDVETEGHLAMWSLFPPLEPGGQRVPYYSYTGALEGPMKKIHASSDWREFSLPLDRTGKNYPSSFVPQMDPANTVKPPERLEVSIHCSPGTVYLRNVKLVQWTALPQTNSATAAPGTAGMNVSN